MPAPTHRVSIVKQKGLETWSNDYLLSVIDMDAAADAAADLVIFERNIHSSDVLFNYYLAATVSLGDRVFRHVPINQNGLQGATSGTGLPLFNTVRMDMMTADSDPARKYYRLPIVEANQADGVLTSQYVTVLAGLISTYLAPVIALGIIVTNAGNTAEIATVTPNVQMRQLHRRKRPVTP